MDNQRSLIVIRPRGISESQDGKHGEQRDQWRQETSRSLNSIALQTGRSERWWNAGGHDEASVSEQTVCRNRSCDQNKGKLNISSLIMY